MPSFARGPFSRLLRSLIPLLLVLLALTLPAGAATFAPRILVVHSYHQGNRWTDNIVAGLHAALSTGAPQAEIAVEYLDTKRFLPERVFATTEPLFRAKYRDFRFDVIITSDDNALAFVLGLRDELFPGIPLVFCGINDTTIYPLGPGSNTTGVIEDFNIKGALDIALDLLPDTRHVYSINDSTESSLANIHRLREIMPQYSGRISFTELSNITAEELVSKVRDLPGNSIILHLNFFRDSRGRTFNFRESIELVGKATERPMFTAWDWYLGHGVVGGLLVSGHKQGELSAGMALRILQGEPAESIPIQRESPNAYMFDYIQLQRFGIDERLLPEGSVVINKPETFYYRYHDLIWSAAGLFSFLTMVICVLTVNIAHRRRTEGELEAILANSLVGIVFLKKGRHIVKVNQRVQSFLGYQHDELTGHEASILHLSQRAYDRFGELYYERLRRRELIHVEFRLRRKDGSPLWCLISGKALHPPDLDRGVIWVIDDVSDRKAAEKALRQSRRELEQRVEERTAALSSANASLVREIQDHKRTLEMLEGHQKQYYRNLQAIFDSLPDAIVTVDTQMRILEVNESFVTYTGLPRVRLLRSHLTDTGLPCVPAALGIIQQTISTGKPVTERRVQCGNGDHGGSTFILSTAPFLDHEGTFSGAVLEVRDISRLVELENKLHERTHFGNIIGASDPMQRVFAAIEKFMDYDATVLIQGESGTGKELVAEAIHYGGQSKDGPFVKVNCSALPEALLESELFGHVRGAFTGAVRDKVGRFEAAESGTILLDEIGDISPAIQLKLLRFLGQKEFERVGENRTRKANVRVITATNVDLADKVRQGQFREDLYYRLKVMVVNMPALRHRGADIALLAGHFAEMYAKRFRKEIRGFEPEALNALVNHDWPGNVRELKHVIEHACIICPEGSIRVEHLPPDVMAARITAPVQSRRGNGQRQAEALLDRETLVAALDAVRWNKSKAARSLGVSRTTLYRKMEEFRLN
jgi:PAS domain S-box-containing protein